MASVMAARLHMLVDVLLTPTSPHTGDIRHLVENAIGGRRWKDGIASGQANRVYYVKGDALAAGATDSYDTLAAGSLEDVLNQAIDLDELKGIYVKCITGAIKIDAPAANFMGFFGAATDFVPLAAGHAWAMDFGAAGLDVTANSKFDIVETTGASAATYDMLFFGAN